MRNFLNILIIGIGVLICSSTKAADFTQLGADLAGAATLFPGTPVSDVLGSPYGAPTTTPKTTTVPGSQPGTTTPQKQCNIGGAVLVVNPAPNSPVTVQATVSNVGNVNAPSGGC